MRLALCYVFVILSMSAPVASAFTFGEFLTAVVANNSPLAILAQALVGVIKPCADNGDCKPNERCYFHSCGPVDSLFSAAIPKGREPAHGSVFDPRDPVVQELMRMYYEQHGDPEFNPANFPSPRGESALRKKVNEATDSDN